MDGRYRSFSGSLVDPEKERLSYDSDEVPSLVSSRSSRSSSSSRQPMLGRHARGPKFAYHLPRRRFNRYFVFAISTTIIVFMYYLARQSWASNARIEQGLSRPPPPPPVWEQFPFLKRYHGGIRTLVPREKNRPEYPSDEDLETQRLKEAAKPLKHDTDTLIALEESQVYAPIPAGEKFDPYPSYGPGGERWEFQPPSPCSLNNRTGQEVPLLLTYKGVTKGFPDAVMGSHEVLGLRDDMCFERYGRLGPYGYGYSKKYGGSGAGMEGEREGSEAVWDGGLEIDYGEVHWAEAQEKCMSDNAHRFTHASSPGLNHFFSSMGSGGPAADQLSEAETAPATVNDNGKRQLNRTAVIIRTWWDYEYDDEDMFNLRALINELSIQSGSEYVVHFLIHVKDDNLQIWADEATHQRVLDAALPAEFRGMGTLWSERQMGLIYGGVAESFYRDLPVHGAYRSSYMPVQYFAHMHPEYEFFWQWEMDIRYTGHFYHLFDRVAQWARQQPRKGLWERSGRFYVPAEHGSWDDFRHLVRVQMEHGTASQQNLYGKLAAEAGARNPLDDEAGMPARPVWGPLRPTGAGDVTTAPEADPQPPTGYDKDDYRWGVGEDADLITFNPLFDPAHTGWLLAADVTGYNTSGGAMPPRRAAITTAARLSRRLLATMHRETMEARHTMFSEMWPGSCALHHGLKAVYAPHPVYIDRAWPPAYLAAVFNNGRHGAAGGARTSVFADDRQHNFLGTSWYYHAGFAPNLWKRWLGYKVDNDGGEEWEMANEGRMCLPAMLLHPVKQVDLIYDSPGEETGEP